MVNESLMRKEDFVESRIERMRQIVEKAWRKEAKDKDTLGVLLFGSLVTGKVSPDSDIDLLVIAKQGRSRTRSMFDGEILDKVTFTEDLMDDFISKGFSLDWLIDGKILYDPHGVLTRLKRAAKDFTWREDQIKENERIARKYLCMAEEALRHDPRSALFLLQKATEEFMRSLAKRHHVKTNVDIGVFFKTVRFEEKEFYELFKKIQGLEDFSKEELEFFFEKLEFKKWDRLDWNVSQILKKAQEKGWSPPEVEAKILPLWKKVPTTSLHKVRDCLRDGDLECAVLYLREASLWYAKVKRTIDKDLLIRLQTEEPEYYKLFLEINGLSQVNERKLQKQISSLKTLLSKIG